MTEDAIITRAELARIIDHTLLAPEATDDDVTRVLAPGIAAAAVAGFPAAR
jgi:deoxyribose-phosphate aldolase